MIGDEEATDVVALDDTAHLVVKVGTRVQAIPTLTVYNIICDEQEFKTRAVKI